MTSRRDVLERCSTHELDGLIRWALRERVAGASPSPDVWERIKAHIERCAVLRQTRWGFSPFLRAVDAWLSADTLLPMFVVHPTQRDGVTTWGYDLGWVRVLSQHRTLMWSP